ncbi:MAG: prephenate dehydratase [Candidatus Omnitrophica bacterium]|nr:prephenate dehydratase [Candidatus Omnitrophota bacterium]
MTLKDLRLKIDGIDERIVQLLNDRAKLSQAIGQNKLRDGQAVYAPHREKEVLDFIRKNNQGPLTPAALQAIYCEIMSSSLALEKSLRVATLGTAGSFTSIAARKKFGSQIEYVDCRSVWEVFRRVAQADCDYGVVPIENSTEGAVTHTFDALLETELKICSQVLVKVSHCLCAKTEFGNIKKIYSNPQVFGQCRNWLQNHLAAAQQIPVATNTEAVALAAKEKNAAAIASQEAAKLYAVPVLRRDIQDIAHNTTRFLILGQQDAQPTGSDKTSILFSVKDKVGALYHMLKPFYDQKINLTKIESRPSKKKAWEYNFFVDFAGHRLDPKVQKALAKLEPMCQYLKVLGSYPVVE